MKPSRFYISRDRSPRPPEFVLASTVLLAILIGWTLEAESLETPSVKRVDTTQIDRQLPASSPALREGTDLVEQHGQFRMAGDRIAFFPSNSASRYVVLENLNLQRIAQVMTENPAAVEWSVSGTLTEYRGNNYLFVRSAVVEPGIAIHEQTIRVVEPERRSPDSDEP